MIVNGVLKIFLKKACNALEGGGCRRGKWNSGELVLYKLGRI